eukprot:CAMPEP_0178392040 /NCGR_PEP_ID=MMETSP0689_2-20121128/11475_1 /TAXON_ID=160604 /ORGANISM="Amphidinium massartii, Strain CS-259" /LENGTH=1015 /DNA_ID=CAMNT_0020012605 /DNA_START=40 /DNA_END=3084 /DNA_ORIENTATION=+
MDFDDLDDAIEQRMKEVEEGGGDAPLTEAEIALLASNRVTKLYEPKSYMAPVSRNKMIPFLDDYPADVAGRVKDIQRQICLRVYLFYGPGDTAANFCAAMTTCPPWMELIIHEWPGHGLRESEPGAQDLTALADDAYTALKPSLQDMAMGGTLEGAPFAFIGISTGTQVLVEVARKAKRDLFLEPSAVLVIDRAPPHMPLFSQKGQELLKGNSKELMEGYRNDVYKTAQYSSKEDGEKLLQSWVNDLKYACDVREIGYHKCQTGIVVMRASGNSKIDMLAKASSTWKEATLSIQGGTECFRLPVIQGTRVDEVKQAIASVFGGKKEQVVIEKTGGGKMEDSDALPDKVTISGVRSFKNPRHQWPHPYAIIGCGYNGIKTAMEFLRVGQEDFVMFDRNDKVGGYCWITAANKYSKIQTEFGSFHINWGPEFAATGKLGGTNGRWCQNWDTWFKKPQVLEHFQKAAEEYGVLPHAHLQTNVQKLDIRGDLQDENRFYELSVESLTDSAKNFTTKSSIMFCYHGSMMRNRRMEYPGEDSFGGQIGYGMADEFTYDDGRLKDANVAILGNGAFAVENVRTCIEHGAKKVYLVTRRKNLASPRVPCWFVHQGPLPTPGGLVLKMFEPMYELAENGSPWDFWSVHSNKARTNVTIMQNSRFGIGDITFLCLIYGALEYVEDTLKRLTPNTMHLTSGRKLENVSGIIKSLGLLGDFGVDKFHQMTEMVGRYPSGDWHRFVTIDATGMNAANFTTFSLGIGVQGNVRTMTYCYDYPQEVVKAIEAGVLGMLPKNKERLNEDKPAYVTDVKFDQTASMIWGSFLPDINNSMPENELYKHAMYHTYHGTDAFLKECIADWDKYQKHFKEVQGIDHEYVPYPYTKDMIDGFYEEYSSLVGWKISSSGPEAGSFEKVMKKSVESIDAMKRNKIPALLKQALKCHKQSDEDPFSVAEAKSIHKLRDSIMSSSAGSALDFDDEAFEKWSEWTNKDVKIIDLEADTKTMMSDPRTWQLMFAELEKVKAPA